MKLIYKEVAVHMTHNTTRVLLHGPGELRQDSGWTYWFVNGRLEVAFPDHAVQFLEVEE